MLRKLIILLVLIVPVSILAQDKIAYIITNEVFSQMPELADVETKLTSKQEEIKKNVAAMEAEYNKKIEEFRTSTDSITASLAQDRQKQLEQIQERYEVYLQNSSKELEDLRGQLLAPLQQKFQKAVQDVGAEQGYTYILDGGSIMYANPNATNAGPLVKAKLGMK